MKSQQPRGRVPSFSVQAPMSLFYFTQKMLRDWTYEQAHVIFKRPIVIVRSHPLENMRSHSLRLCPLFFGLCVDPSLYALYAKRTKRLSHPCSHTRI